MTDLLRFLLRHAVLGMAIGIAFTAILLVFDIGHLRSLTAADPAGTGIRLLLAFFIGVHLTRVLGIKALMICGLSGGVDSSVAAVLIHEAIGDQLTCVFVDTGLMRSGEADQVVTLFREHYNIPLVAADEEERFLTALAGESDPEKKRKTIGKLFIDVFEDKAKGSPTRLKPHRLPSSGTAPFVVRPFWRACSTMRVRRWACASRTC